MAEGDGKGIPQRPRISSEMFRQIGGGASGKSAPPPPKRPPTWDDIRLIAKDVARQEFVAISNSLAQRVHEVIAKHLSPVNQKFVELYNEVNKIIILVNTMQGHLERKGVIHKEEFSAEIKKAAQEARAAYAAAVKAMKDATVKVETEIPTIETPPFLDGNGQPLGNHAGHLAGGGFDPGCAECAATVEKSSNGELPKEKLAPHDHAEGGYREGCPGCEEPTAP